MKAIGVATVATLGLAACGSDNGAKSTNASAGGSSSPSAANCATGQISGQGSTFQQNMQKQWIADFTGKCSGAQVNYEGTGSGAGISQFGSGTVDFAGSDVTMKPDEQSKADTRCNGKAIHLPVTAGGIAIIYNLKGVNSLNLSAKTLAGIFQGTIKKWDDPSIKADNSGANLPATAIVPYVRADGSGTTSVFSKFLAADAGSDWKLGSGKTLSWPNGVQAAKGSDGVTAGVKQTDGGITYAEVSFAKQNSLPTAKVKGTSGDFTDISSDTVSQAINSGFTVSGSGNDLSGKIDFTKIQGYPISTVSYVIACEKYSDANKAKLLKAYLTYAVTDGQAQADQLGFAPLPSALVDKVKTSIAAIG
jgi:phosphate transport system substrate-binding protein